MAISLTQLGKIYALTSSPSEAEAATAEESFRRLFFKWCDEQGLPTDYGITILDQPDEFTAGLLAIAAPYVGARYEALSALHGAVIGRIRSCQWLDALQTYVRAKVEDVAQRYGPVHGVGYRMGVCAGVRDAMDERFGSAEEPLRFEGIRHKEPMSREPSSTPLSAFDGRPVQNEPEPPREPPHAHIVMEGRRAGVQYARKLLASLRLQ